MPDDNKFQKLREVGYSIPLTCGFCVHRQFNPESVWGECQKHRYFHKKHENPPEGRGVSILKTGTCPDVEMDPGSTDLWAVGHHSEFLGQPDDDKA